MKQGKESSSGWANEQIKAEDNWGPIPLDTRQRCHSSLRKAALLPRVKTRVLRSNFYLSLVEDWLGEEGSTSVDHIYFTTSSQRNKWCALGRNCRQAQDRKGWEDMGICPANLRLNILDICGIYWSVHIMIQMLWSILSWLPYDTTQTFSPLLSASWKFPYELDLLLHYYINMLCLFPHCVCFSC